MKNTFFLFICICIGIAACNDPIAVGSDILNDGTLEVEFIDNLPISAQTLEGDLSVTFRNFDNGTFSASNYMVGVIDDATFGRSEAVSYFTTTLLGIAPEFSEDNLDSVVLNIPFDTLGFYGDVTAVHDLELRILTEEIELERDQALFADTLFAAGDILGSRSLVLNPRDSLQLQAFTSENPDSLFNAPSHLRIPLDRQFWIDLSSSGSLSDNETYQGFVPGFALSSTPSESSMIGLNMMYGFNTNSPGNISFFMTTDDSTRVVYNIPIGRIRHSNFTNDFDGSELGQTLGTSNPSLLYAQSQSGTDIAIDVSEVRNLGDIILNSARLTASILDEPDLDPIEAFLPFARDEEGDLLLIGTPLDPQNPITEIFENGESAQSYVIDITNHLNNIKEGLFANDTIFLIASSKAIRPNRSIILGTDHPNFPLGIDLIITNP